MNGGKAQKAPAQRPAAREPASHAAAPLAEAMADTRLRRLVQMIQAGPAMQTRRAALEGAFGGALDPSLAHRRPAPAGIVQRVWNKVDKGFVWDAPLDGVTWHADDDGLMWYEITAPQNVKKGSVEGYRARERVRMSWDQWNAVSVEPDPKWIALQPEKAEGPDPWIAKILAALENPPPSAAVVEIFKTIETSGGNLVQGRFAIDMFNRLAAAAPTVQGAYEAAAAVSPVAAWRFLKRLEDALKGRFKENVLQPADVEAFYRRQGSPGRHLSLGLKTVVEIWAALPAHAKAAYVKASLSVEQFSYTRRFAMAQVTPPTTAEQSVYRLLNAPTNERAFVGKGDNNSIASAIPKMYDPKGGLENPGLAKSHLVNMLFGNLLTEIHDPHANVFRDGFSKAGAESFRKFIAAHHEMIAGQLKEAGVPEGEIADILTKELEKFIALYDYGED